MHKILVDNVSHAFASVEEHPSSALILDQLNMCIESGDIFGIVGMSGAGKSTLLRLLATLERPTRGAIIIDGIQVSDEALYSHEPSLRAVRETIGIIFQELYLYSSMTLLDNVAFPLKIKGVGRDEREERALSLLKRVGLGSKEGRYPLSLSGGERQRVAIARALAAYPTLLLCDEITSALDPATRRSILDLLSQLNQEFALTIVLITHEMEVVRRICNRVAVLDHGRIVEQGTVEELFATASHPVTQELLQQVAHEVPSFYSLALDAMRSELWLLTFRGAVAREPLLSWIIKHYPIEVNIILGNIDRVQGGEIGKLLVLITAEPAVREEVWHFLQSRSVICHKWREPTSEAL